MNSLEVFEDKHSDEESNDENEYEGDDADDEHLPPLVVADQLLTPLHLVGSQLPHHICSEHFQAHIINFSRGFWTT